MVTQIIINIGSCINLLLDDLYPLDYTRRPSQYKDAVLPVRWSHNGLIFMMEIPIHGKTVFILRWGLSLSPYTNISSILKSDYEAVKPTVFKTTKHDMAVTKTMSSPQHIQKPAHYPVHLISALRGRDAGRPSLWPLWTEGLIREII